MIEKYKKGQIIYPAAVARNLKIHTKDAYKLLDTRDDVRKMYMIHCPNCSCSVNSKRFYSISDINLEEETGCEQCDTLFLPKPEDIIVLYEKM